jgi:hypothetical protein
MDFEKSDIERKDPTAFDEAIYIRNIYFDLKGLFNISLEKLRNLINYKTVGPINIYIENLLMEGKRINKSNIEDLLSLIDGIEFMAADPNKN